ncbi:MAG: M20/M25/M40 family metallo-hydrolase [Bacteroidales bacterium]|nr:M20/M25/M40 family metallo-hydrolase [Bacteroidales bacterium]
MSRKIIYYISFPVMLLLVIMVTKTLIMKSKQADIQTYSTVAFNDSLVWRLQKAIQYKTLSFTDTSNNLTSEFDGFHAFLFKQFPAVFKTMTKRTFNHHALLLHWKGRNESLSPLVLLAHQDVVNVNDSAWKYPPFSGKIVDDFLWGRGTLDDKGSLMAILEACEKLITENYQPQRSIFLAFGDDEEINGVGAKQISAWLQSQKIEPYMVIDEGLVITEGIVPMTNQPVALIGTSEKGYLSLRITATSDGGHSSTPKSPNSIELINLYTQKLCAELSNSTICKPVEDFMDWLGPELAWPEKVIFANRWLTQPIITGIYRNSPSGNALVTTTCTPTVLSAGNEDNVVPQTAFAILNLRLLPGTTIENVLDQAHSIIKDEEISIRIEGNAYNPARVSSASGPEFNYLAGIIRSTFPDALVMPNLMLASSDSRNYSEISKNVFRFAPYRLNENAIDGIHGNNERISVSDYRKMPVFYYQLMKSLP